MINTRNFVLFIFAAILSVASVRAQDLSRYRGFQLGMSLPAAAKKAEVKPSEAKLIYQRPAVIQELEWHPADFYSYSAQGDPVKQVFLGFYNGELYRIVVNYDQERTEGLTDQDLIDGISAKYGSPTMPSAKIVSSSPAQVYTDSEKIIARWEDAQYSFNLFRSSYGAAPGMVVLSKALDALAQSAIVEAIHLNEQEAPQREVDRQKKMDDEKNAAGQKARPASKANFRP
jgi:hypothetical protein